MRHALVVVDRRFVLADGIWYTQSALGPDSGDMWLPFFDRITVAGRADDPGGLDLAQMSRTDPRLEIHCLPNLAGLRAQVTQRHLVRRRLAELMDGVDAVILRLPGENSFVAANLAAERGLPVAGDMGGCAYDGMVGRGGLRSRLYASLRYRRTRRAVQRCQFMHYVTQNYLQARYPAAPGAAVLAVSNVSIPPPDPAALRARLVRIGQRRERLVFGTVGSLVGKLKGVHIAIEALGRLRSTLPAFEYRVLGGGDPAPLQALAERCGVADSVVFDGLRPGGQPVLDWLDGIDVYLQPSLREGVARATIEAMSRACPAIVSDIAGMYELIDDPERVPPADVPALMRAIGRAVDPAWQRAQAERNWSRAQDYSSTVLEPMRHEFWTGFAQAALKRKTR